VRGAGRRPARTAPHLALNPIGKMPVLIDGKLVLPESDVIVSYS